MSSTNSRKRSHDGTDGDGTMTTPVPSEEAKSTTFSTLFSLEKIWANDKQNGKGVLPVWFQYPYNSVYPGL